MSKKKSKKTAAPADEGPKFSEAEVAYVPLPQIDLT